MNMRAEPTFGKTPVIEPADETVEPAEAAPAQEGRIGQDPGAFGWLREKIFIRQLEKMKKKTLAWQKANSNLDAYIEKHAELVAHFQTIDPAKPEGKNYIGALSRADRKIYDQYRNLIARCTMASHEALMVGTHGNAKMRVFTDKLGNISADQLLAVIDNALKNGFDHKATAEKPATAPEVEDPADVAKPVDTAKPSEKPKDPPAFEEPAMPSLSDVERTALESHAKDLRDYVAITRLVDKHRADNSKLYREDAMAEGEIQAIKNRGGPVSEIDDIKKYREELRANGGDAIFAEGERLDAEKARLHRLVAISTMKNGTLFDRLEYETGQNFQNDSRALNAFLAKYPPRAEATPEDAAPKNAAPENPDKPKTAGAPDAAKEEEPKPAAPEDADKAKTADAPHVRPLSDEERKILASHALLLRKFYDTRAAHNQHVVKHQDSYDELRALDGDANAINELKNIRKPSVFAVGDKLSAAAKKAEDDLFQSGRENSDLLMRVQNDFNINIANDGALDAFLEQTRPTARDLAAEKIAASRRKSPRITLSEEEKIALEERRAWAQYEKRAMGISVAPTPYGLEQTVIEPSGSYSFITETGLLKARDTANAWWNKRIGKWAPSETEARLVTFGDAKEEVVTVREETGAASTVLEAVADETRTERKAPSLQEKRDAFYSRAAAAKAKKPVPKRQVCVTATLSRS